MEFGPRTNILFCIFLQNLTGDSKRIQKNSHQAIPLSKHIRPLDNRWLIREAKEEKTPQAVNQSNPLKTPGSDGMHRIFYQKC